MIFKVDPDTVVKFDIANSSARSEEWVTSTVDLSAYAGKEIAAFGLVVDGEASDYQINIGQMKYTSGEAIVPAAPTGLTIDKAYDTGEMVVSWDMASYDEVKEKIPQIRKMRPGNDDRTHFLLYACPRI